MRAACTPLLRFAADTALEFVRGISSKIAFSEKTLVSAVGTIAWQLRAVLDTGIDATWFHYI